MFCCARPSCVRFCVCFRDGMRPCVYARCVHVNERQSASTACAVKRMRYTKAVRQDRLACLNILSCARRTPCRLVPKFLIWEPDRWQSSTLQTRSQGVILAGGVRYEEVEIQERVRPQMGIWGRVGKNRVYAVRIRLTRIFHPATAGFRLRILHHIRHFACPPPSTCTNTLSAGGLRKAPALAQSSQAHDESW